MTDIETVINAAGKLTALGGSAQSDAVANAQATWATRHVDLAALREHAGKKIAEYCDADAACVTSGAAAGVAISVAAIVAGTNQYRIERLPFTDTPHRIAIQAGHAVDYGATVSQLVRMGGATPLIVGSVNRVTPDLLADTLDIERCDALLFVKSHHTVQENMVDLETCLDLCKRRDMPVIVDAAAEEDLRKYTRAGADLVTYSGGKAFGGPTSGFIVGRADLVEACEMQFRGIARTMKVGKEAIMGLLAALEEYVDADANSRAKALDARSQKLIERLSSATRMTADLKPDEAGRPFSRVSVSLASGEIRNLVAFLRDGSPSIRTRNHHLDQGYLLIDPRELKDEDIVLIADRLLEFDAKQK